MVTYRNLMTGRELERPTPDEWLEASPGWERLNEDTAAEAPEDIEMEDDQ